MKKRMIFFGQDPSKAEFYNLYVRASDIPSREVFREIQDELLILGFILLSVFYLKKTKKSLLVSDTTYQQTFRRNVNGG